jgi:hypothetical protein
MFTKEQSAFISFWRQICSPNTLAIFHILNCLHDFYAVIA